MLPQDFVEYTKRFEVGFLGIIGENGPDIKLVHFEVDEHGFVIEGNELTEGRACLAFANEEYVWASENASVNGHLEKKKEGEYHLLPDKVVWTVGFDIKGWPRRIVRRWKSQ